MLIPFPHRYLIVPSNKVKARGRQAHCRLVCPGLGYGCQCTRPGEAMVTKGAIARRLVHRITNQVPYLQELTDDGTETTTGLALRNRMLCD